MLLIASMPMSYVRILSSVAYPKPSLVGRLRIGLLRNYVVAEALGWLHFKSS